MKDAREARSQELPLLHEPSRLFPASRVEVSYVLTGEPRGQGGISNRHAPAVFYPEGGGGQLFEWCRGKLCWEHLLPSGL